MAAKGYSFVGLLVAPLFITTIFLVGLLAKQSHFLNILFTFSLSFSAYVLILFLIKKSPKQLSFWIITALVARIVLLFSDVLLSDDIFRFIWDGGLIHAGLHPLADTPSGYLESLNEEQWMSLYDKLNSKNYHTIYPPLAQLIFSLVTWDGMVNLSQAILKMRLIMILSEIGVGYYLFRMLDKLSMPRHWAFIYLLNPLVIVETVGSMHFESTCLFFLLVSFDLLSRGRMILSSMFMSFSIATKLLPLMFLPILIKYLKPSSQLIKYLVGLLLVSCLLFLPFFMGLDVVNFLTSLDLYFQKFEFNASFYYIMRWLGKLVTGYNQIWILGPFLSLLAVAFMMKKLVQQSLVNMGHMINLSFLFFLIYLATATTVHPWYLIIPLGLSVFQPRIFMVVWSFVIVFSYSLYDTAVFKQFHLWFVCFEYLIVGSVFYLEIVKKSIGWR